MERGGSGRFAGHVQGAEWMAWPVRRFLGPDFTRGDFDQQWRLAQPLASERHIRRPGDLAMAGKSAGGLNSEARPTSGRCGAGDDPTEQSGGTRK